MATAKETPVPEMCAGCGWVRGNICAVITEPKYLSKNRGYCFAKATPERIQEIEREIKEQAKFRKREG